MRAQTGSPPLLAFGLRDSCLHESLNKCSRQWLVRWEVDGALRCGEPLSSFLKSSTTEAVGNKLQWFENAANHTGTLLCLNAGIP
jgi:hypothetical protein